jgi:ubiquinone/menaquinone biosynthesis C-methylase UbiE
MLSHRQAKAFYDRFGTKQDWQGFYEDVATEALIQSGEFAKARAVVEFGCGTGRFAEKLLESHLPADARYIGVDISETMVALAKARLGRFGSRVAVCLSDGSPRLDLKKSSCDRFVSTYVLDLLTFDDIRTLLREAWRVLSAGGLLGLVSLTHGFTPLSRIVEGLWMALYAIRPRLVGGCRPIALRELIAGPGWKTRYNDKFSNFGVPSEVLVAEKVARG